ncbi:MAG TPA: N-carbamoylsarcosine amidase [Rhodospirillaceae bacterium]|jgi:maleamate amidohydrolase|nr:N-carbamoylsarcosine amidase [Rhodospirillaceae bacterium]MAX62315.1 N-carbamoylsarcosine amidase [Rhodospirillaceae bacterium]MBB56296.1 N-carbamoylsarcosine amidase [Rhodospirillaceae bacterium]HAE01504.1 N-carbamoylsarcosine amidase [Rhodospirillaceae bacterium]HAJ19949.1 N-carbamoylsarcosine amidase [Rhodospirillaceae bacterium]|tara:strand:- start:39273 stop:39917 length:645 start_codon:yes stop_codon:yes gene_type:complete
MSEDLVTLEPYRRQGFGSQMDFIGGVGLLIIDLVNGFADPEIFGGGNIPGAIAETEKLLAEARAAGWPVAHSRIVYADDGSDHNIFSVKVPGMLTLTENAHRSQIVPELTPVSGELVVRKNVPSAFFGTNLAPWLTERGVRTLAIAGAVTSGCVRASVVDAMCYGFRPAVISNCVGDRAIAPHDANLFDMGQKYAEVLNLQDALPRLKEASTRP